MRRWIVPTGTALLSLGAIEVGLHVLTRTEVLGFLRTSTPACYTRETARYGVDENGSPIWHSGERLAGKKTLTPSRVAFDERGVRHLDAQRFDVPGGKVGFFGDSYTAGLQVADSATFPRRWEALERARGRAVTGYNFGVDGTGTWHQYLRWRTLSSVVALDHVVVCLLPQNDVLNNHERLGAPFELPGAPYLCVREGAFTEVGGALGVPGATNGEPLDWRHAVLGKSFLLTTGYKALRHLRSNVSPASTFQEKRAAWLGVYGEPPSDDWREAWAVTEEALARFGDEVRATGADFTLVLVADSLQIAGADLLGAEAAAQCDFDYPNRRLRAFCAERGLRCIDALPNFLERKRELEAPYFSFADDGHYSELGHSILAGLLAGLDADGLQAAAPGAPRSSRSSSLTSSLTSGSTARASAPAQ